MIYFIVDSSTPVESNCIIQFPAVRAPRYTVCKASYTICQEIMSAFWSCRTMLSNTHDRAMMVASRSTVPIVRVCFLLSINRVVVVHTLLPTTLYHTFASVQVSRLMLRPNRAYKSTFSDAISSRIEVNSSSNSVTCPSIFSVDVASISCTSDNGNETNESPI